MFKRLLLLLTLCAATAAVAQQASPNDQARFLAGLGVNDPSLSRLENDPVWAQHAQEMDKAYGKQELRQLSKVRAWSRANVPGSGGNGTVYYFFSGPDFLYANAFYPNARTYVLCGTEPVGSVPDVSQIPPPQIAGSLAGLRQSLKTILSFHYFITKEMRVDFNRAQLGGTLPVLYVFLARAGCTIQQTTFVKSPATGVKIDFTGPAGAQTLYYFKCNLSNGGGNKALLSWCAQQGPGMSLLKAASYLMHTDGFSTVRNFLLTNSRVLVQDDSGIPLRNLSSSMNVQLYGTYEAPIELFAKNYQGDLAQAYAATRPPALGFAFGYHWQVDRGMLMVGTRR